MRTPKFLMATSALALSATTARADLAISGNATKNVSCSGGVCTATAKAAVLSVADLTSMLASGDVAVNTGGGANNIVVKAAVSWTNASRLTLDANRSVSINKPVSVTGSGAVTITTNDGGSGGDLMFNGKGNVKFWDAGSSLVVNGKSYTLVKDIATLASDIAAKPSGFYALANDYDASVDGTYTSAPITTELTGTFEGLGHVVSNLKANSPNFEVGLFAEASGTLRDIGVVGASINSTASASDVGTLLGRSELANIIACFASGSVVANAACGAGGLVGVAGFASDGAITRSHASVSVLAGDNGGVGGLVGQSGFSISLSYATGRVKAGNNAMVGGLVGAGGSVAQSYATGKVSGGENSTVGGLIGSTSGDVGNSYSSGAVNGGQTASVAGFIGEADGNILSSYATGHVAGGKSGISSGFIGAVGGVHYASSYWDIDTTGKGKRAGCGGSKCDSGAKGLTTEELRSGLPTGFDPAIWGENAGINNGYPYLIANRPPQ